MGFIAIDNLKISGSTYGLSIAITGFTSGSTTLTDNDNTLVTEKAIKTYVDSQAGSATLSGLSDTEITTPSSNEALVYNGTKWINSGETAIDIIDILSNGEVLGLSDGELTGYTYTISGLTDTEISGPSSNESLVYNGTKWVNSGVTSVTTLVELSDTTITNQAQGQLITYNSDTSKWINSDTITGNITIVGDLYVSGTTVTIDVADMNVADNIILINSGETGAGVTLINAGIEVDRGSLTNYRFVFNETDDVFKIGEIGSEQPVATRQVTPTDTGVSYWNNGTSSFLTSSNLVFDGVDLYIPNMTTATFSNIVYFDDEGGKLTYGAVPTGTVTEVTSSTTDQLTVATSTSTPALTIVTSTVTESGNALATGDQIYDFVTGLGYQTIITLYEYTGVTSDRTIGYVPSGQTLGMLYITNNGTVEGSFNLGTSLTGNEISPYTPVIVASGETMSVTVNMRLSSTSDTTIYVSSSSGDWTNLDIDVEWAPITYQNGEIGGGGGTGTVTEVSGAGTINGLTLTGTVTTAGSLTLGGTLAVNNADWSGTDLSVEHGGTGLSTVATDSILTGNGTDALTAESNLTFDGSILDVTGDVNISGSLTVDTMALSATTYGVYYDTTTSGFTYDTASSGGGGFLGTVTKDTAEPSNLSDKQWVMPAPQSDGTFEYTFDNFLDVTSTAINVNISLENVMLKYNEAGDYWVKEGFNKPLSSGKTWVGTTDDIVSEMEIIEEWSTTETLNDIGQKYDLQTQTLMKTSAVKTTILQNYIFVQNIDLATIANTKILNKVSGKKLLLKNIKLIILNTENSTFTVNIGRTTGSYVDVVNAYGIANVVLDEYYILPLIDKPTGSDGTVVDIGSYDLYLRISATDATTLNAHLVLEGFIY